MSKPLPVAQLRDLLTKAIARCDAFIAGAEKDSNPQVVAMVANNKGRRDAYDSVLRATRGDGVCLRIDANGISHHLPNTSP